MHHVGQPVSRSAVVELQQKARTLEAKRHHIFRHRDAARAICREAGVQKQNRSMRDESWRSLGFSPIEADAYGLLFRFEGRSRLRYPVGRKIQLHCCKRRFRCHRAGTKWIVKEWLGKETPLMTPQAKPDSSVSMWLPGCAGISLMP